MAKDFGLGQFTESAKEVVQQLIALNEDLRTHASNGRIDVARVADRVKSALGAAEAAKAALEKEGVLDGILQRQVAGLNVNIHVHTKE